MSALTIAARNRVAISVEDNENIPATLITQLADALEEALATIERVRNLEPTWHRGMYGSPDDMFSGISIHRALESRDDPR